MAMKSWNHLSLGHPAQQLTISFNNNYYVLLVNGLENTDTFKSLTLNLDKVSHSTLRLLIAHAMQHGSIDVWKLLQLLVE